MLSLFGMQVEVVWPLIVFACAFMVMDIATGFIAACYNHDVQSQKMKAGLWHKCGFLLAIMFGILCEWASNFIDLGFTLPIQTAVCTFIICIEIVSIIENLGKLSPDLAGSKFLSIFHSDKLPTINADETSED